jgi:hypothetical protein
MIPMKRPIRAVREIESTMFIDLPESYRSIYKYSRIRLLNA